MSILVLQSSWLGRDSWLLCWFGFPVYRDCCVAFPRDCLWFVIVVFPDHTHSLFLLSSCWGRERWLFYFCCTRNVMSLLSIFDSSSWCHGLICNICLCHFLVILNYYLLSTWDTPPINILIKCLFWKKKNNPYYFLFYKKLYQSKEGCKDQESIQSNTIPDPTHHMGKRQKHTKT